MIMRGLALIALVAGSGLCGCGDTYIILKVQADLQVPAQADGLHVVTLDTADLTRTLADEQLTLTAGESFPLEVLLEPKSDTPKQLREQVTATLGGTPVARAEGDHPWSDGRVNVATFTLTLVP